jgi:hypothetical protein
MLFRSSLNIVISTLAVLLISATPVAAAPQSVLAFGADTWSKLKQSPQIPSVVVFSTTDCTHCPRVIDEMAAALRTAKTKARLIVVVMDGAGHENALRKNPHYRHARDLYAFDGDEVALRYSVNPEWRGLTPYVALLPVKGEARFHSGSPPADAVRTFLKQ